MDNDNIDFSPEIAEFYTGEYMPFDFNGTQGYETGDEEPIRYDSDDKKELKRLKSQGDELKKQKKICLKEVRNTRKQ